MNFLILIPARYASSRFPGKPLAELKGVPMIVRVCRQVEKCGFPLAVATDDERIARVVEKAGYRAILTKATHTSGTERVEEAASIIGQAADVVINVQGDEPFIDPDQIKTLASIFLENPAAQIATLVRPYPRDGKIEGLFDPNLVKVEINKNNEALTFSRSVIPYMRNISKDEWPREFEFLTHIGIYAYRMDVLKKLVNLAPCDIEKAESLEQLRWIYNGYKIMVRKSNSQTIGIDTPEDLRAAEEYLQMQEGL